MLKDQTTLIYLQKMAIDEIKAGKDKDVSVIQALLHSRDMHDAIASIGVVRNRLQDSNAIPIIDVTNSAIIEELPKVNNKSLNEGFMFSKKEDILQIKGYRVIPAKI